MTNLSSKSQNAWPTEEYFRKKADGSFASAERALNETDAFWENNYNGVSLHAFLNDQIEIYSLL